MTVSPQRAQDGSSQPNSAPKGGELGVRMETLPPTLFQLPSLKPSNSQSSPTVTTSASDQDDQPRSPTPPAVQTSVVTPVHAQVPTAELAPVPAPTTSPEPSSSRWDERTPASIYPADQPAGRSWMETVRSHGVMVVLLLIVVIAAVMTSGDSSNPEESSVAETTDLLDIEEGLAVNLPLPSSEVSQGTSTAVASTSAPLVDSSSSVDQVDEASSVPISDLETSQLAMETEGAVQTQAEGVSENVDAPAGSTGVAALSAPSIAVSDDSNNASLASDRIPNLSGNTTNATAASSRIPSDTDGYTFPSLASLNETAEPVSQAAEERVSAPAEAGKVVTTQYRVSSTPAPVTNWLQQLDKYQRVQQASAETNSTPQ